MKHKIRLLSLAVCAMFITGFITGCAKPLSPAEREEEIIPTGYWYLTDNGERVWRKITADNVEKPQKLVTKNYPTTFGNGG